MKSCTRTGTIWLVVCLFLSTDSLFAQSIPIITSNAPLCAGVPILQFTESSSSAIQWLWSGPNGFSSNFQNPSVPYPTPAASGIYKVTVTDDNGGTSSASVTVTVYPAPVASAGAETGLCPGEDVVLQGSGGISCLWQPFTGLSSLTNCATTATPPATTHYTLKVTDANGCTATDQVTVFVYTPKALVCNNNVNVSLNASGTVALNSDMVLDGTHPFNGFYTVNVTNAAGQSFGNVVNCALIGQKLTYRVVDNCSGNSCGGKIVVEDKWPPVVTCANITVSCAVPEHSPSYLKTTLGLAAAYPAVQENCIVHTLTWKDVEHDLPCDTGFNGVSDLSAYVVRSWQAQDAHNNFATCSQNIYIKRRHVGEVQFPLDTTLSCQNPNTDPSVTGVPFFSEFGKKLPLFPGAGFCQLNAVFADHTLPVCDGTYKIIRTWTVYDWCQPSVPDINPKYYTQIIKVLDNAGPTFECPTEWIVGTDPYTCCVTVNLPDLVMSDHCSRLHGITAKVTVRDFSTNDPIAVHTVGGSFVDFIGNNLWNPDTLALFGNTPCVPTGTHLVQYQADDDCGNTTTCSFNLVVQDQTPPSMACNEFTQVALGLDGKAQIFATTFDNGSKDNCCALLFEARRPLGTCVGEFDDFGPSVEFCCTDAGDTIMVTMRATDCNGNTNACMVQVFVEDKVKPVCEPPAHTTVVCENFDPTLWAYGMATGVDNCCLDTITATANYNAFDSICNRGTIIRTFRVFDCAGNSSQCTQRVIVTYEADYYLRLPNDVVIKTCDGTGNYGSPTFFNRDCELVGTSFSDEVFTLVPDACFKILRTWKIINWCDYDPLQPCTEIPNPEPSDNPLDPNNIRGPIIAPPDATGAWVPTIIKQNPTATGPTNYSDYWNPYTNCYKYVQIIKVVDAQDPVIENCPASPVVACDLTANDPALWNDAPWYDPTTESHDLCEGPADLHITATDACTGNAVNFRCLIFFDLDNDGDLETVVNSSDVPAPGTVHFGNAANPNFTGGAVRTFDGRALPGNQKYQFALQTTTVGKKVTAALRWNTLLAPNNYIVPELPYGTHKIKWIVEDGCGNERVCEYNFTVKDCKAPSVVCINGLSANIMPTGMIQLWASDFLQYGTDNCTPANRLRYAIRKSGQGAGFPVDAAGDPVTSITFDCTELGQQPVELWAMDLAGNVDFCLTYLLMQDNLGNCPTNVSLAGVLKTEAGAGLEEAQVEVTGTSPTTSQFDFSTLTDAAGMFDFAQKIPPATYLTLTPTKDNDPLNGVSTYDLVLISKHILGLEPLESPYRMIAADANRSGSITTFDIVELRKLILGIYTELPNNTAWRFVDHAFTFSDSLNPFKTAFPEFISLADVQQDALQQDFVAVKIGDVNGSVVANTFTSLDNRTTTTLLMDVENQPVKTGDVFEVTFLAAEPVSGFQFTLNTPGLDILEVLPDNHLDISNFGIFPSALTVSANFATATTGSFRVKYRATTSGRLSDLLAVSNRITRAEAYSTAYPSEKLGIALRFHSPEGVTMGRVGFELYQNQPNPFVKTTTIGFHLPEAATATLTVFDDLGRTVWTQRGDFSKGYHTTLLDRAILGEATGMLYYRLETERESAVRKMIR